MKVPFQRSTAYSRHGSFCEPCLWNPFVRKGSQSYRLLLVWNGLTITVTSPRKQMVEFWFVHRT